MASVLTLSLGFAAFNNREPIKVEATQHVDNYDSYTYTGSYYDSIDFYAMGGMNGALRKSLTSLIKPNDFYIYSGNGEGHLSEVLQEADEDPTNPNNMVYLYTRDSVAKTPGTVNSVVIWNREHVWCQSKSSKNWGEDEGGTDILHLRPTYPSTNQSRNDLLYGDLNKIGPKYFDPNTKLVTEDSSKMPFGYANATYFEPLDCVKGDVARIVMYVWTTYNEYQKKNGSYYNPLYITDIFQSYDTLLKWHMMDQPDVLEGNRNNYAESSIQGNRNPFVDHPELGWRVFGNAVSQQVLNECKATYPFAGGLEPPLPTSISLNKASVNVLKDNDLQLTASLSPNNADAVVMWSTSDDNIASVSPSGLVTANNIGVATITARVSNGIYAECTVTVTDESGINYIKVASYNFDSGNSSTSEYSNDDLKTRFNNCTITGPGLSNVVTSISDTSKVYAGYSSYHNFGLKLGTGSANGTFTLNLNREVRRVVVKTAGWSTTDNLKVGSANAQTPGVAYNGDNPIKTITFDISPSDSVNFVFSRRGFIQSIDLYSELEDDPNSYLKTATSIKTVSGTENINNQGTQTSSVTFSELGYSNGQDVNNVSISPTNLVVSKGSGSNGPKYYNTGTSLRLYGGNTMTFTYSRPITQITLNITEGSPSALSASTGTLNGNTWTGSATSIVISNTNSSGHLKIASISVSYETVTIEVSDVIIRFGAMIPINTWSSINEKWPISDYGVMIVKESTLTNTYHETSVKNAFNNGKTLNNIHKGSAAIPTSLDDDYYFLARLNVLNESDYSTVYCAAPYIVADGEYCFLDEMRYSVNTLAAECLDSGESPLSSEALNILKGN